MEKYWFANRRFGIGWRPATWQGWLLTITAIVSMISIAIYGEFKSYSELEILTALGAVLFAFLTIVWRTGEPLRWNWHAKRGQVNDYD